MASLSLSKAWTEASAFVVREASLLLPVALLLVAIPMAVAGMLLPADLPQQLQAMREGGPPINISAGAVLGMIVCLLISAVGRLSLYALALKDGISVAEALQLGLRKMPVAVGANFLLFVMIFIPAMIFLTIVTLIAPGAAPAIAALANVLIIAGGVIASARLLTLESVIADQSVGPREALRTAWRLGKGYFPRLMAVLLIFVPAQMLAVIVAKMIFGLIGLVLGGREGMEAVSAVASALALGGAAIYISAFCARIYRQLNETETQVSGTLH